ncbi:hypothetical protein C8J56DRAFT_828055 [Mycena floridula]|nr:hypothetical protein C8J56DRAFT_828055 [Mycena floridula]
MSSTDGCETHLGDLKDYLGIYSIDELPIFTCSRCKHEIPSKRCLSAISVEQLQHNSIPASFAETDSIRSFIDDCEADLLRCDEEISRLQGLISLLEKRQARIRRSLSVHQSILSPIRRLPAEVLGLIFSLHCNPGFWETESFDAKRERGSRGLVSTEPFAIATTCHYWRKIMLSTPSLWSTIMLVGSPYLSASWSQILAEDIELVLQRSGQQPLKLWTKTFSAKGWPYSDILRRVAHRVQEMHLLAESADPFGTWWNPDGLSSTELTGLTALEICGGRSPEFFWLPTAKNLQQLHLRNVEPISSTALVWAVIPTGSLTSIAQFGNGDALTRLSPRLSHIKTLLLQPTAIHKDQPYHRLVPSQTNAEHLRLVLEKPKIFEFGTDHHCENPIPRCWCRTRTLWASLSSITLPCLQSLHIQCRRDLDIISWLEINFTSFIQRSNLSGKLTSLVLDGITISDPDLIRTFQQLPSLTQLTLSESQGIPIITTNVISALISLPLIPHLRVFKIHIHDGFDMVDSLAELVLTRSQGESVAPLSEVHIRVMAEARSPKLDWLQTTLTNIPSFGFTIELVTEDTHFRLWNEWIKIVQ